jgi:formylglycine-generating enzyme required for sulfatase activity
LIKTQSGRWDRKDCPNCPVMAIIPPIEFDYIGEGAAPNHMKLPSFAAGKYEVTVAEFSVFVRETGRKPDSPCSITDAAGEGGKMAPADWAALMPTTMLRTPVTCISIEDARAYAAWLTKKTGRPYLLPRFGHWMTIARAGRKEPDLSDDPSEACAIANVFDLQAYSAYKVPYDRLKKNYPDTSWFTCSDGFVELPPVGSKPANKYGIMAPLEMLKSMSTGRRPSAAGSPAEAHSVQWRTFTGSTPFASFGWMARIP